MTNRKKYKVTLTISFEHVVEVETNDQSMVEDLAHDAAMDYLDITLSDSQKFDSFWEYQMNCKTNSITVVDTCAKASD